MAVYSNGINTKDAILQTARTLFYQQGYRATTTRQLSSSSNTNLGLIKYHFNSKADVGLAIYAEIDKVFTQWAQSLQPFTTVAERLMLASTAEVQLTFNSPEYCRFFNELYEEPKVLDRFMETLHNIIPKVFIPRLREIDPPHTRFIELCLLGVKTNMIRYVSPDLASFESADGFLRDHLRLHAELFNLPDMDNTVQRCQHILSQYSFALLPDMTLEIKLAASDVYA